MRIGQLAKRTGLTVEALRFYERAGVLGKVTRDASGYRVYDEETFRTVVALRWVQETGLRLEDIAAVLGQDDAMTPADRIALLQRVVDERVAAIQREQDQMAKLIERLQALRAMPFDGLCVMPGAFVDELVAAHERRRDAESKRAPAARPRRRVRRSA